MFFRKKITSVFFSIFFSQFLFFFWKFLKVQKNRGGPNLPSQKESLLKLFIFFVFFWKFENYP